MVDRSGPLGGLCGKPEQLCCVSVNKIFDSTRDKDCLEDVRCFLSDQSQEVIDRASAVRTKNIEVINTNISIDTVPFNRGYFQVTIRYFFCVTLEVCVCNTRILEVQGLCVFDKKVILFGSEKNVSVFTSDPEEDGFCVRPKELKCDSISTLPIVVVEVAAPIALDTKLVERCKPFGHCCINQDAIPDKVRARFEGNLVDGIGANAVFVTIGLFSVIRMERPVQLVLPACNFCLPEKDCKPTETTDPCSIFSKMCFPLSEFFPTSEDPGAQCPPIKDKGCCK
ncbi:MAG: hypothetical protein CVU97_03945 [Firmicutes bacterium HGW-Firmicutes-21]|nr:MAG: hypothetical protein CVU97_03945 [Firmicutes bacterium HGW-Firmicutes-21]